MTLSNIKVYNLILILFSLDIAFYDWQGLPKKTGAIQDF